MRTRRSLEPSPRAHGAQRMLSATTLTVEALVVFFAVLVAHQLSPDQRVITWTWGMVTAALLLISVGLLKRGSFPYYLGMLLQIPIISLGIIIPAMWVVGAAFAVLYVYGVYKGNQLDREKDEIDRRVIAARDEEDGGSEADSTPR